MAWDVNLCLELNRDCSSMATTLAMQISTCAPWKIAYAVVASHARPNRTAQCCGTVQTVVSSEQCHIHIQSHPTKCHRHRHHHHPSQSTSTKSSQKRLQIHCQPAYRSLLLMPKTASYIFPPLHRRLLLLVASSLRTRSCGCLGYL